MESLCRDLSGKNVLLVDDVSDTGDTLELARHHLLEHGAKTIRIAVLHHKQTSTVEPDYFAHRVIKWRWIIYPWAITEDITGFIKRLPHHPADTDEAIKLLQKTHVYHQYTIRSDQREHIRQRLADEDIASAVFYPIPLHQQKVYKEHYREFSMPAAEEAAAKVLSLPIYPELSMQQIDRLCQCILDVT